MPLKECVAYLDYCVGLYMQLLIHPFLLGKANLLMVGKVETCCLIATVSANLVSIV